MGSGFNEIAVVALIAFAIFFLPRLKKRRQEIRFVKSTPKSLVVPGRMRLAIFVSILWTAGAALFFQPWNENLLLFLYIGIGPVFLGWGLIWVLAGYRKYRK
ncbi:MAG: hypothetical protein ABIJ52_00805 [Pseudomonadota bacterium]|nr:hypothetical protein [Pseudomonadota bacterium]